MLRCSAGRFAAAAKFWQCGFARWARVSRRSPASFLLPARVCGLAFSDVLLPGIWAFFAGRLLFEDAWFTLLAACRTCELRCLSRFFQQASGQVRAAHIELAEHGLPYRIGC